MSAVPTRRILLVEDDASIREVVRRGLEAGGFAVTACGDGPAALERLAAESPDLVLLDVMLPGMDGFDVCREIRRTSRVPVVMLTARDATVDVVVGLELGADDYLTKPFELPVLMARLRAVLRRADRAGGARRCFVGGLEIDVAAHRATLEGRDLALTATEFRLLAELAARPGQVFTRQLLPGAGLGLRLPGRLAAGRRGRAAAARQAGRRPSAHIATVRGVGYRFVRER